MVEDEIIFERLTLLRNEIAYLRSEGEGLNRLECRCRANQGLTPILALTVVHFPISPIIFMILVSRQERINVFIGF